MRDGWAAISIRDVATLERGVSYKSSDLTDGDGVPLINLGCVERGGGYRPDGIKWFNGPAKPSQRAGPGDLLIANTDLTRGMAVVGCPVLLPNDGSAVDSVFSLDLTKLVVDRTITTPAFLNLVLSLPVARDFMKRHTSGTTVMHLRVGEVGSLSFLLPPLAEQRRIVDLIGAVDIHAAACRRLASRVTALYHALLDDVYVRATVSSPLVSLGDIAATRLGKMLDAKRLSGDAYPYLANVNVQWDDVRTESLKMVPLNERERAELTLMADDVLVCEGGEAGRTAVLSHDLPGVYFQKAVHRVRCGPSLQPRFLMHFMRYATRNSLLDEFLSALTIQHLTGEKLRRIPVPLPPVAVQEEAVAILDATLMLRRLANRNEVANASARTAMLADLLSGEHEVPVAYDRFVDDAA